MSSLRSHHRLLSRFSLPTISVTVLALLAWLALPAAAAGPTTIRVSVSSRGQQGNGDSFDLSLTDDARFVAFDSLASNLVRGDTNNAFDVFLKNLSTGSTKLISRSSGGAQGDAGSFDPAISGDG